MVSINLMRLFQLIKFSIGWAVVVAQLVEWSLPTPEVRCSKPVIGKLLSRTFVYCQLY